MTDMPIESMRIRTPLLIEDDIIIIEVDRSIHAKDMKDFNEYNICVNRMIFVSGFIIIFAYYGFII